MKKVILTMALLVTSFSSALLATPYISLGIGNSSYENNKPNKDMLSYNFTIGDGGKLWGSNFQFMYSNASDVIFKDYSLNKDLAFLIGDFEPYLTIGLGYSEYRNHKKFGGFSFNYGFGLSYYINRDNAISLGYRYTNSYFGSAIGPTYINENGATVVENGKILRSQTISIGYKYFIGSRR